MQEDEQFDFAEWLAGFGLGATNRQLSKLLRETVVACEATGKKGSVTLKIAIGSASGIAQLAAEIKVKRPEPALPGGSYYVTESGGLVEDDPRQQKLPVVSLPPSETIRFPGGGRNGGAQ